MSLETGIQFGGSNMCIAYSRDEKLSIIVNEAGYRTTPSVVSFTDEEFLVGIPAKQNIIRNSKSTILYTKHFIGKSVETAERDLTQRLDCEVIYFQKIAH
jgi:molecular chaperone DnaK